MCAYVHVCVCVCVQKTDPELGSLLRTLHESIAKGSAGDLDEYAKAVVRDAYKVCARACVS